MTVTNEIISLVERNSAQTTFLEASAYRDRMLLGDCVELLRYVPKGCVDLVVTDPPYIANYKDRSGRTIANDNNTEWLMPAFSEIHSVLKNDAFCVSFYGWNQVDKFMAAWRNSGFRAVGHFTWVKAYSSRQGYASSCHECAYLLAKGRPQKPNNPPPDVLGWKYTGNKLHPTQKPVSALQPIIEAFSKPGDLVLDPFGGSGSTAVAAKLCGRQYLLIEMDERYFHATRSRLLAENLE